MIKRIAINFFMGYAACSAAISLMPIQEQTVPVAVFDVDGDQVTTYHRYEVRTTAPQLFNFHGKD